MDTFTTLLIVAFAAFIHATFQLSVSVLTLLGGHSIGKKRSKMRLIHLTSNYVGGVALMTVLLVTSLILMSTNVFGPYAPTLIWAGICGVTVGIGISAWLFYYKRHSDGTELWIPRQIAKYLYDRTKDTKSGSESFGLGLMTSLSELLFTIAPIIISALLLSSVSPNWQLLGISIYLVISLLPLVIVWLLVGSGYKISAIQNWRAQNKWFLQFASGSGLLLLGLFLFINIVFPSAYFGVNMIGMTP